MIAQVRADVEHLGWPSRTIDPDNARRFIARYDAREAGRMPLGAFARQSLTGGAVLIRSAANMTASGAESTRSASS